MSLTCEAIGERARDLAGLAAALSEAANNPRLPEKPRFRAAVMVDQALELGQQFEALLGEIRQR